MHTDRIFWVLVRWNGTILVLRGLFWAGSSGPIIHFQPNFMFYWCKNSWQVSTFLFFSSVASCLDIQLVENMGYCNMILAYYWLMSNLVAALSALLPQFSQLVCSSSAVACNDTIPWAWPCCVASVKLRHPIFKLWTSFVHLPQRQGVITILQFHVVFQ